MKIQRRHYLYLGFLAVVSMVLVILLSKQPYWVSQGKFPPATQMMVAAMEGDNVRVAELIEQGRDVNETAPGGATAFFFAVCHGHYDIAKLLISKGADPKMNDGDEATMIACVARHGDVEFLRYLLSSIDNDLPSLQVLSALADSCEVRAVEDLLQAMGDDASWGVDAVRHFAQTDRQCSDELQTLINKYE